MTSVGNNHNTYQSNGNIATKIGVGTYGYGSGYGNTTNKQRLATLAPFAGAQLTTTPRQITYTCFDRPKTIEEGNVKATFTYNGSDDRIVMNLKRNNVDSLTRYYLGGRYEADVLVGKTVEKLYLGGDYYSAPMVYIKNGNTNWTLYNLGRDYLGSITQVATANGTPVAEYRYDAWGCLKNPENLTNYTSSTEPDLFTGRGYTGHEHLRDFGLINMNARLYDPVLGRFISPDPYVQTPDFTQSYNRYSYALNNPLKYKDPNGEFLWTVMTALWRLPLTVMRGLIIPYVLTFFDFEKAGNMLNDAWSDYGKRVSNAAKIDAATFAWDSDSSIGNNLLSFASRLSGWEGAQMRMGRLLSHFRNSFWRVDVSFYHGAVWVNRDKGGSSLWGITLGNYINTKNLHDSTTSIALLAHEYGHTKQSMFLGPLYLPIIGAPSFVGDLLDNIGINDHDREWYEIWSNNLSYNYHERIGDSIVTSAFDEKSEDYLMNQHANGYSYVTLLYYLLLLFPIF